MARVTRAAIRVHGTLLQHVVAAHAGRPTGPREKTLERVRTEVPNGKFVS